MQSLVGLSVFIAVGIAFGVALIPVARRFVAMISSTLASLFHSMMRHREPVPTRTLVAVAIIVVVASVATVGYFATRDRSIPRDAVYDQRWARDSALNCSDSALIAQRDSRDSANTAIQQDRFEPSRSSGDSAWLAWKKRVDSRREMSGIGEFFKRMDSCDWYQKPR